ncbi:high affinity cGMP-specific 3',5'-cyclic phosphodiesterase 9A-like [Anneissia japonica]|uniref:high affinity cGMP-specific 3',5'-cyclic phosphodiesterase 9A-like n=1 Tax=Anneissia japonica TaxID=1529436 RepID=UPI0014257967|nr:high affinity cGMP-specific 3',5'-cyclic phosphodiesterase 9A-like [Anneissia japonica]
MTNKVIYFTVDGKPEQAEFRSDFPADDVKDCFHSASEAGPNDILKLYNQKGNIVNISPSLEENGPDSRYRLEVVAMNCDASIASRLGFDMTGLESRLQELEKKVKVENGDTPSVVYDLRNKVESFREKLEGVEHLSWMGLFKDLVRCKGSKHFYQNGTYLKASEADQRRVWEKFQKMSNVQLTTEVREYLRQPSFDNWQWEDAEMLVLLQQMYIDLDFVSKFHIEMPVLQSFLFEVYRHYNNVPFHNFKHCFCVCQMMYGISWLTDLCSLIGDLDVMIMITATICHDLDHPGYNNAYQVNAKTELALRYNDISPLENHHCAIAFEILEKPHCNIFKNIGPERYKRVREGMIKTILATDMARHNEILNEFKSIKDNIDYSKKKHKDLLMMICIKVSDISNEARPMDVSDPWIDCLLQEFFNQGDVEKLEGLPVAPFMDREKTTKPSSQVGFIGFVLLPLFESLAAVFPVLDEHIVEPVRKALKYYTDMVKALEEEKKRKEERQENGENRIKNGDTKMRKASQTNGSVTSQVEAK